MTAEERLFDLMASSFNVKIECMANCENSKWRYKAQATRLDVRTEARAVGNTLDELLDNLMEDIKRRSGFL